MPRGFRPIHTLLLVVAYVPILGLIPLAASRRDGEIGWHARNGQFLFAAVAAAGVLATLVAIALPSLSCVYAVGMAIAGLLYASVALLAAVKAVEGQRLLIPGISSRVSRIASSA